MIYARTKDNLIQAMDYMDYHPEASYSKVMWYLYELV